MVAATKGRGPDAVKHSRKDRFYMHKCQERSGLAAQTFKSAAVVDGHELIYFDRPGQVVKGTLVALAEHGSLSASHFVIDVEGQFVEIKAHKLLRELIFAKQLMGEYIEIEYRGRVLPRAACFANASPKSYFVYVGRGIDRKLINWHYPPLWTPPAAEETEAA